MRPPLLLLLLLVLLLLLPEQPTADPWLFLFLNACRQSPGGGAGGAGILGGGCAVGLPATIVIEHW